VKEKGDIAELAGNSLENIILYPVPYFPVKVSHCFQVAFP
jgi:hypothetical protein